VVTQSRAPRTLRQVSSSCPNPPLQTSFQTLSLCGGCRTCRGWLEFSWPGHKTILQNIFNTQVCSALFGSFSIFLFLVSFAVGEPNMQLDWGKLLVCRLFPWTLKFCMCHKTPAPHLFLYGLLSFSFSPELFFLSLPIFCLVTFTFTCRQNNVAEKAGESAFHMQNFAIFWASVSVSFLFCRGVWHTFRRKLDLIDLQSGT